MSRRKLFDVYDDACKKACRQPNVDYKKVFVLLVQYHISQYDFVSLAKISSATLHRLRINDRNIRIETLLKVLTALNKLNDTKIHTLDDIVTLTY